MSEAFTERDEIVLGAPVAAQHPRKNVPVDDAWRVRLSPSTEAIISAKAVTFIRGQQAFHLSMSEAPKFAQAFGDWEARERT